jgi:hypothetical protein
MYFVSKVVPHLSPVTVYPPPPPGGYASSSSDNIIKMSNLEQVYFSMKKIIYIFKFIYKTG